MDNLYLMSASRIDIDRLIAEVELKPEVWSTESMPHARAKAWKEIAFSLGSKVPLVKLKWKNVRDIFRREYIKNSLVNQAKLTSPADYTGKWRYFRQLWPVFKTLRASCNTDSKIKHMYEIDEEEGPEAQEESEGEFEVKINKPPKVKRKPIIKNSTPAQDDDHDDDEEYNHESETIFVEEFAPESTRDTETDKDYDSMYLNSLLPFFKMLSPVRKLCVRNQIQALLINELNAVGKM